MIIPFQAFGDAEVSGEELHDILREIDTNMNGQVELDEYLQVKRSRSLPTIPNNRSNPTCFPDDVRHQVRKHFALALRGRRRAGGDPQGAGTTPKADHRGPFRWWSVKPFYASSHLSAADQHRRAR